MIIEHDSALTGTYRIDTDGTIGDALLSANCRMGRHHTCPNIDPDYPGRCDCTCHDTNGAP